jgi:hypothetical protein
MKREEKGVQNIQDSDQHVNSPVFPQRITRYFEVIGRFSLTDFGKMMYRKVCKYYKVVHSRKCKISIVELQP